MAPLDEGGFTGRYELRRLLGEGGMGEVRLCKDRRIGREVALKVIRSSRAAQEDVRARFLREARVQGQLEHPAVVPVYDVGLGPEGNAYFTMKRVRGIGLDEILDRLEEGDSAVQQRFSRRRLLTAFSNICLAVDFAHQHGVLHRDLKPGNIMLGDFGEVYVLDWGVARIAGMADPGAAQAQAQAIDLPPDTAGQTVEGQVVGTPGYMAPEQARGHGAAMDGRADVYSLGAILFEILTLQPLHERAAPIAMILRAASGVEARPSVRYPEAGVPPELEAICVRATVLDPAERFPSARDLHEAVERYLDGDRDLMLRQQMAQEALRTAEEAAERALSGESASEQERERALQAVGRALALDPTHREALGTLVRLLTTPPRHLPADARAEQERVDDEIGLLVRRGSGRMALILNLPLLPLMLWMGIHDRLEAALFAAAVLAAVSFQIVAGLKLSRAVSVRISMALSALIALAISRMFGPLVLMPAMALMGTTAFVSQPERRVRRLAPALSCLLILFIFILEWLGVLPRSYLFHDGMMSIRPQMFALPQVPTMLFLLVGSLASIIAMASFNSRIRDALAETERRLRMQTWQLSRLVPGPARVNQ